VVDVYDSGVLAGGRAYLVTQYCAGGSLEDYVAMVGRLTPTEAKRIGAKIAGALVAAHRRDIFHRDIRPANVLISGVGEPMLADFGLLCLAVSDPTPPPGPRAFVAPEAYLPELMSTAADIFSLGATLYALLSGGPPKAAPSTSDGDRNVPTSYAPGTATVPNSPNGGLHRAPTGGRAVFIDGETLADLPHVPPDLMAILKRAMAHDPRDRYPTASHFHQALTTLP
jgi:serine/threonine protein kinase